MNCAISKATRTVSCRIFQSVSNLTKCSFHSRTIRFSKAFSTSTFHSQTNDNEQDPESEPDSEICKAPLTSGIKVKIIKKPYDHVDWLPFEWTRRLKRNPFEESGDILKGLEYNRTWPKPDFEFSDELKTSSEDIKRIFSLYTASKGEVKEAIKRRMLATIQRHPNDFQSLEVDIALRTLKIRSMFHHTRERKKERVFGRKRLDIMIKRRNRKLKFLYKIDTERFNWLCNELQLEYKPSQLGGLRERYTKKWDLRRMTREYCENMIKEKNDAYHEELEKQQQDFLKEKQESLAWIEEEEKEIARITKELENLCS